MPQEPIKCNLYLTAAQQTRTNKIKSYQYELPDVTKCNHILAKQCGTTSCTMSNNIIILPLHQKSFPKQLVRMKNTTSSFIPQEAVPASRLQLYNREGGCMGPSSSQPRVQQPLQWSSIFSACEPLKTKECTDAIPCSLVARDF